MLAMQGILSAACLSAALLSLAACGEKSAVPAERAIAVQGEKLTLMRSSVTDWHDVGALVTSVDMADARARIPGILESLTVREGDLVKRGQIIGRIVDNRLGYESAAYGAQVAAAQAQVVQSEAELGRVKYLYDNKVYSKAKLDQAVAAAQAARAQRNAASAQQSAVGAVAGQGAVTAPSAGRVLVAQVPAGSAVAPGTSIATITSGPMVLRLELPETLGMKVHPGSAVIATGLADEAGVAAPRASVSRVYPAITGGQMFADVPVPGLTNIMVGRRVTARVAIGTRRALIVPQKFVQTSFGIDYVSVLVGDKSVSRIPVQTAPTAESGRVEILSGANEGDRLVAVSRGAAKP